MIGPNLDERVSPCSTFKVALSLIGFDAGVLKDAENPVWEFQEGYDDFLPVWRTPQCPRTWMKYSCIWYSQVLVAELGWERAAEYLALFGYGNETMSEGVAWVNGALEIAPREQVRFIQEMVAGRLPVSRHALEMTRTIAFLEELPGGWHLFGKTGWSGRGQGDRREHGWFVGWVEREGDFYPFAYLIREENIALGQRIPRVKRLLEEAGLIPNVIQKTILDCTEG